MQFEENKQRKSNLPPQSNKDYLMSKYSEVVHDHEKFEWSDLLLFRKQFWFTCLSCMFMQIAINNSITIGSSVL